MVAQLTIVQSVGGPQNDGSLSANSFDDELVVQFLLNQVPPAQGGPPVALVLDGKCGPETITAVKTFQTQMSLATDSRVDPGGATMTALNNRDLHHFEGITDREEVRSIILRPLPDWNYTRGDFATAAAVTAPASPLTFDPDAVDWLPQGIQDQLVAVFALLLDPANTPSATWGVSTQDWRHAHLSLWSGVFGQPISAASVAWLATRKGLEAQLDTIRNGFAVTAGPSLGAITPAKVTAYRRAYFAFLKGGAVQQLLEDFVALPEALIVHHTFEGAHPKPTGMASDDVRRHWMTNAAGQILTPPYRSTADLNAAGDAPGGRNEFICESSSQLAFLIGQDGVVYVGLGTGIDLAVFVTVGSDALLL